MEIPHKLKEYIDNNRGSLPPITNPDEPLQLDSLGSDPLGRIFGK